MRPALGGTSTAVQPLRPERCVIPSALLLQGLISVQIHLRAASPFSRQSPSRAIPGALEESRKPDGWKVLSVVISSVVLYLVQDARNVLLVSGRGKWIEECRSKDES